MCQAGVGNTPGDAFGPGSANSMRFSFSCETAMVVDGAAVLRRVLGGGG
jgi:aspartate aminotransferase